MENTKAVNVEKADISQIKNLYLDNFPKKERKPIWYLSHLIKTGRGELLKILLQNQICGFIFVLITSDTVLIDYLAIDKKFQGNGIGSAICDILRKRYAEKLAFLEIEFPNEKYENNNQRVRRKKFYLKNGLFETCVRVHAYGTEMEVLTFSNVPFSLEKYFKFMQAVYKKPIYWLLRVTKHG